MSKYQKTTNLYKTPFSKAYWQDAVAELKDTHMLVFAALMIALRLVLKQIAIPISPVLKINTAFFVNALGAMVFGPVFAAICAAITDVLGYLIRPEGIYFLPFILTEIAGSVVFALFLYRAKVSTTRVMLSRFTINFFVNILLQTPIMMWYYAIYMGGKEYTFAMAIPGIIKNVLMFPLESLLLTLFLSVMLPITNRFGLTYAGADAQQALKFTKKQVISLILLFFIGAGCVCGYLTYYYNTTSLSANYSASQRRDANLAMMEAVYQNTEEYDNQELVVTVESAHEKFLGKDTTYQVAVYVVDMEKLQNYDKDLDTIRGLSKSKAAAVAKDGIMTRVGSATIVASKSTGEILSFQFE